MKKNKVIPIILIVIAIILILLGGWFFFIKDNKGEKKEPDQEEKKEEKTYKNYDQYTDRYGMLIPMSDDSWKPLQEEFVIDGVILIGTKHSYFELTPGDENAIVKMVENGYEEEGINSFFYKGENIKFYIDTKYEGKAEDVKIFVIPKKTKKELRDISYSELKQMAEQNGFIIDYKKPDTSNYKYVGENLLKEEKTEGVFDLVITYKEKVAYYMDMIIALEPRGE